MTAEELEQQARMAAKQRQTEYRKTAKALKSKKQPEQLEAIDKLSDHTYITEVSMRVRVRVGKEDGDGGSERVT